MKIHGIYSQRFQGKWKHRITYVNGRVVVSVGKLITKKQEIKHG